MSAVEILEKIGESLSSTATVRSVFGEPIHVEGKTVVPVAKVAYGFGAGSGVAENLRLATYSSRGITPLGPSIYII